MHRFRLTLVALVAWLFLLYNIERIHEPMNIASFVYVLSAGGAVLLIFWRGATRALALSMFGVCFVLLLVLKSQWGYPILGAALPITVTETVALGVTFSLACWLAEGVGRFEDGAVELTTAGRWEETDFDSYQAAMYREVRRARRFERPLAVIYLRGEFDDAKMSLHQLIEQSQQEAVERFARVKIGEAIGDNLRDCDMLARRDDGYVVLMPEADLAEAGKLVEKIEESILEKFSMKLDCGVASFPDQEVTFSGLLDRASTFASGASRAERDSEPEYLGELRVSTNAEE